MGNVGSATINVNQGAYYPGDWVQGRLTVNLSQHIDNPGANLVLKFKSVVRNEYRYTRTVTEHNHDHNHHGHHHNGHNHNHNGHNHNHTRTVTEVRHHRQVCAEVIVPTSFCPGHAPAGHHEIHFNFQLPLEVQPTYRRANATGHTQVDNLMKVRLRLPGSLKGLAATHEVRILGRANIQPMPFFYPPKEKVIKTLGLFKGGSVKVHIPTSGHNVLHTGQPIAFQVEVENKSKHTFKKLRILLHEHATYNCHGMHTICETHEVYAMNLAPHVTPNTVGRILITPATPVFLPPCVLPSANIPGGLDVQHTWEVVLVNDSLTGTDVSAKGGSPVRVVGQLQPPAPLPPALQAAAAAQHTAYASYVMPGSVQGGMQPAFPPQGMPMQGAMMQGMPMPSGGPMQGAPAQGMPAQGVPAQGGQMPATAQAQWQAAPSAPYAQATAPQMPAAAAAAAAAASQAPGWPVKV